MLFCGAPQSHLSFRGDVRWMDEIEEEGSTAKACEISEAQLPSKVTEILHKLTPASTSASSSSRLANRLLHILFVPLKYYLHSCVN